MNTGPCFYCPDLPAEGETQRLAEEEARHAGASRRIRVGDTIGLIDGRGTRASGKVESVARGSLVFTVQERRRLPPPSPSVVIASAVPKGERFRTLIDMLTQIGVAAFVPLHCERSTVKPRRASLERWRRIAIEACKQSRNPFLPEIGEPATVRESLAKVAETDAVAYADAGGGPPDGLAADGGRLYLYIGPEGGLTGAEREVLAARGARPVGLGDNILRVETAAVAGAVLALMKTNM